MQRQPELAWKIGRTFFSFYKINNFSANSNLNIIPTGNPQTGRAGTKKIKHGENRANGEGKENPFSFKSKDNNQTKQEPLRKIKVQYSFKCFCKSQRTGH
jgi:hypothetical protein